MRWQNQNQSYGSGLRAARPALSWLLAAKQVLIANKVDVESTLIFANAIRVDRSCTAFHDFPLSRTRSLRFTTSYPNINR